jgi:hypothetical protein
MIPMIFKIIISTIIIRIILQDFTQMAITVAVAIRHITLLMIITIIVKHFTIIVISKDAVVPTIANVLVAAIVTTLATVTVDVKKITDVRM